MPSVSAAFREARLTIALLSSSTFGSPSKSSMMGRGSMESSAEVTILSVCVLFNPSLHLFPLADDRLPTDGFEGCCFALCWSKGFLDVLVHASDVVCCCCDLDVVVTLLPVLVGASSRLLPHLATS